MLSKPEQAALNLDDARVLRASGHSYRQIRRQLGLSAGQLGHIRRALKREKGGQTRLRTKGAADIVRDLPIMQTVLPAGLRRCLTAAGYRTLGDLADRVADPDMPGLAAIPGIGPHRARLAEALLDQFGLRDGAGDLQAIIEGLFPEFGDPVAG